MVGLGLLFVAQVFLIFISRNNIFFWDSIQFAAKHGLHFYDHGFSNLLLPPEMDSGHPPFFGMYQAAVWKVFGLSLKASHVSMLPFLISNIFLSYAVGNILARNKGIWFSVLMFACPFYLGHSVLVSPDLVLVTGFLLCLLGAIKENKLFLILGSILLCIISMRGFALAATMMIWYFVFCKMDKESWSLAFWKAAVFLPGLSLFLGYQIYHYYSTQWIGFHQDSPWSPSFSIATLPVIAKNIVLYIWRMCDYSMFIIWIIVIKHHRLLMASHKKYVLLLFLLICSLAVLILPFQGLMNHRYFLPIQIVGILLALICIQKKSIQLVILITLIVSSGNFWVYPEKIAQGWDATMAHYPFYGLEEDYSVFIAKQGVEVNDIGTAFPMKNTLRHLSLSTSLQKYKPYNLSEDEFILYSNIMNDFSDEEIEILHSEWDEVYTKQSSGVFLKLYKRR